VILESFIKALSPTTDRPSRQKVFFIFFLALRRSFVLQALDRIIKTNRKAERARAIQTIMATNAVNDDAQRGNSLA
jgi:hypothetical protein